MQLAPDDSYLHLIRELPDVAADGLGELVDDFLGSSGIDRGAIDHWLVHPGGRRIIESVQEALGLSREDVADSYDVLAEHGNVGTPSIFYVMKRMLDRREPRPGERGLMVTVGPGVTVGLMLLRGSEHLGGPFAGDRAPPRDPGHPRPGSRADRGWAAARMGRRCL